MLSEKRLIKEAQRFKELIKKPLITGIDIVNIGDVTSGDIGIILKKLWALQFSGKIRTKDDAMKELHRFSRRLR